MSSIIINTNKIEKRNYEVSVRIIAGENYTDIDDKYGFLSLGAEYAYREDFFPFLHISLLLTREQYRLLIDNKQKVKIRLCLQSFIFDSDNKKTDERVHIDDIFQPLLDDLDNDSFAALREKTDVNNDNYLERFEYNVSLYLLNKKILDINKKIINFVAKDCKVKDVLGYILKTSGVDSVLVSPMQNHNIYRQVLIPPLNFYNSLQHLSDVYGLYNKGMYTFFDFNHLYIIRNDFSGMPLLRNDYDNVYINVVSLSNSTENIVHVGGYRDKEHKCFMVNIPNILSINSASLSTKEEIGNKLKVFNRESIDNAVVYKSGKFTFNKAYEDIELDINGYDGIDKYQFLYNTSSNNNLNQEIKKNTEDIRTVISFNIENTDIEFFKPNKRFIFIFEDNSFSKKYNGTYTISDMKYILDGISGNMNLNLTFIKNEDI